MTGTTLYHDYEIDSRFRIFHNEKQVFTAYWQQCSDLKEAIELIDASIAEGERMRKKVEKINLGKSFQGFKGHCEVENQFYKREAEEAEQAAYHELDLIIQAEKY